MNVEIGAEAALFPEKEYISGTFVAVYKMTDLQTGEQFCPLYTVNLGLVNVKRS